MFVCIIMNVVNKNIKHRVFHIVKALVSPVLLVEIKEDAVKLRLITPFISQ